MKREILLKDLDLDPRFQHRADGLDLGRVAEYAEYRKTGGAWKDSPVAFSDAKAGKLWYPGGFHRYAAEELCGNETILCEVRDGDWLDAFMYSLAENESHGARRTNADKRQGVLDAIAVSKEMGLNWSDRDICKLAKVHHGYLHDLRRRERQLSESDSPPKSRPPAPPDPPPQPGREAPEPDEPDPELAEEEGAELAEELAEAEETRRRRDPDPAEAHLHAARGALHVLVRELTALQRLDRLRTHTDAVWADLSA